MMDARKFAAVSFLLLGSIAGFVQIAAAQDWPRFRGPNGSGIAKSQDIPAEWTSQDILWKVQLPGVGHSSPIVCGQRIFLQSSAEDGKERQLLCLDATSGKQIWARSLPGRQAPMHKKNSLASSTPAADGERVYALFWDGKEVLLCAYDYQGNLVWNRSLGNFKGQHGPGTSPIVHEGKVFVAQDRDDEAKVFALDGRTGKPLWEASRPVFVAGYATPLILTRPQGTPELIVVSTAGFTSYNPHTGAENWNWAWKFPSKSLRVVASPVESGGVLVAQSGEGGGSRHTIAVRAYGEGGRPSLAWEKERGVPYVPCPLGWGEHFYFVNDTGIASCLVAATGQQVWSERIGGNMTASPVLIDGKVFAPSEDGRVYVFAASPKFELLAKNALGEPIVATPAVANGRLYVRGKSHLFCIGKP
jgi:outer membrane protein assembly factor BamB